MTKTIVIDGIEYELTPIRPSGAGEAPQRIANEAVASEKSIVDEYSDIKTGVPGVYDWKEELAKKRKRQMQNTILKKLPRQDSELDKFGNLIIGEGLKQDF